ncbi:GntR family transcriptional regulator [Pseudochrobactrum sp. Wa41.01b-1]|uniref:GntR family transcriptional regulator n=1 Tax=Pseudochrobactrum sp. Wa41.01b-1 TaxID=2864102 RepID=UPI001C68E7F6|nr:GntR family transcriptional regulator [Pseudochrobactrum sp. Wa41.01b-1]QYM71733.1 GntR family transcriptional regulator [Pseudochrobactrum sp. Wa41.01b-1]
MKSTISSPPSSLDRDTAYTRIRELISTGDLKPDEPLSERSLSVTLGLGRTPIREAIRALVVDGLVEIVPQRGTFVRRLTLDDLREIFEIRLALEGIAAFLVAQRGATPGLKNAAVTLRDLYIETELDVELSQRASWCFHDELIRATRNTRLLRNYNDLRAQSGLVLQAVPNYDAQRTRESIGEHLNVYDAIVSGESVEAQKRMWNHLNNAWHARLDFLKAIGSFST